MLAYDREAVAVDEARKRHASGGTRMVLSLFLLAILGGVGAFDTVYYHEWCARLPARPGAAPELKLHALRDLI